MRLTLGFVIIYEIFLHDTMFNNSTTNVGTSRFSVYSPQFLVQIHQKTQLILIFHKSAFSEDHQPIYQYGPTPPWAETVRNLHRPKPPLTPFPERMTPRSNRSKIEPKAGSRTMLPSVVKGINEISGFAKLMARTAEMWRTAQLSYFSSLQNPNILQISQTPRWCMKMDQIGSLFSEL